MNELEKKIVEHDEKIKTLFVNQTRLERVVDKIDKLAVSIEKMAVVQTDLVEEQKSLKKDVDKIKEQPAKDAHEIKMKIITVAVTVIVTAVVTAVITLLAKGGI